MGRQVRFHALPDDLAALEEMLVEHDAVFIPYYHHGPELSLLTTLSHDENADGLVWLARADDLAEVRLRYIEKQGYWLVDNGVCPVVELARGGRFDGTRVGNGRLWFTPTWYDREHHSIEDFAPEFVAWAQAVLAWVRRRWKRDKDTGDYWGPQAEAWRAGKPAHETP